MSTSADWARGYARQADADLRAWELYNRHPMALAAECHRLLFLQMACEKLGKAHLIQTGVLPTVLKTSHGYVAKPLPVIIKQEIGYLKQRQQSMGWLMTHVKHLAREIELLNPAVQRGGRRQDNCEYPWETQKSVRSPQAGGERIQG